MKRKLIALLLLALLAGACLAQPATPATNTTNPLSSRSFSMLRLDSPLAQPGRLGLLVGNPTGLGRRTERVGRSWAWMDFGRSSGQAGLRC